MATSLPCDNHPDTQANMLITNLDNGDTLTLCAFCIGQWARMLTGAFEEAEADDTGPESATEEAGQPEIAAATPDPGPFQVFEPPTPEDREEADQPTTPQETQAAGE